MNWSFFIKKIFTVLAMILVCSFPSFATQNSINVTIGQAQTGDFNIGNGNQAAQELRKVLTNDNHTGLMDLVGMAGFVIVAFGIGQMIMAFKDENADAKARAAMVLSGGVFLIVIPQILNQIAGI